MASLSSIQNPYENQAQNYKNGILQKIWSWFGGRTGADAYRENMAMNASEFDSQLALKQYDQEYNSPTAQVARMRAAGLNPDLNGGQDIDPGSAAELQPDPSTPMMTEGDENTLIGFGRTILSVFSSAVGMVQTFQGIQRTAFQNRLMAANLAKDTAIDMIPIENTVLNDDDPNAWQLEALNHAKVFAKTNLPKRYRRQYLDSIQTYFQGIPTELEARKKWLERETSRKGFAKETSSMWDSSDNVLRAIWEPFGKIMDKVIDFQTKAQEKGAEADLESEENRLEYEGTLDPVLKANKENSQYNTQQQNYDIEFLMKNAFKEILDNLKSLSNEGGQGATLANTVLVLLSLRSVEMLPHLKDLMPFVGAR